MKQVKPLIQTIMVLKNSPPSTSLYSPMEEPFELSLTNCLH